MYQLLNFIRFELWLPKKVISQEFEQNVLEKLKEIEDKKNEEKEKNSKKEKKDKKDDNKKMLKKMRDSYTYSSRDGFFYLNKKLSIDDKEYIRQFFLDHGRKDILPLLIWILFGIFGLVLLFYLIRLKINTIRIILTFAVFGLGIVYAFTMNKYISERIHLIYFGIIGFLFTKDNQKVRCTS